MVRQVRELHQMSLFWKVVITALFTSPFWIKWDVARDTIISLKGMPLTFKIVAIGVGAIYVLVVALIWLPAKYAKKVMNLIPN